MYLKKGVSLRGLQPEMVVALMMLTDCLWDVVVTGGTEDHPDRLPNSLHKTGYALDIRIPEAFDERSARRVRVDVKDRFEDTDYDVVWYDTHLHIEYDPK